MTGGVGSEIMTEAEDKCKSFSQLAQLIPHRPAIGQHAQLVVGGGGGGVDDR